MTGNLQPIFISSLISEKKTSGCQMNKKIKFESISMARQNKCMHYLWITSC